MRTRNSSATTTAVRQIKEQMLDAAIELAQDMPDEIKKIKWDIKSNKNDKLAMNIFLSDIHFYEIIHDDNGNEIYNEDIAARRVDHVINTAVNKILELGPKRFDEVNLILLGDLIDGTDIYSYQESQVKSRIWTQVSGTIDYFAKKVAVLANFVDKKLPKGSKLNVKGVAGNHGELRVKRNHHPIEDNFETLIYRQIDMNVKNMGIKNVTIDFPESKEYLKFDVKGWKFLIRHQYKQQNLGTPSVAKKVLTQNIIHKGVDLVAVGHYHDAVLQGIAGIKVLRVGCVSGINEYSEKLGVAADPEQTLLITSSSNLVDYLMPVNLAGVN